MISDVVVLAAVLIDLVLGDPRWITHPVVAIGKYVELLESVLRRFAIPERIGGVVLLVVTVVSTVVVADALIRSVAIIVAEAAIVLSIYFSWACLAARSLHGESKKVADALDEGDLPKARLLLSMIVGRDTENLDEPEIWRALVETVTENTSDGVIAPLFYLMLGGPLLGLAYKAVNTLDSMVGYRNERYLLFGWASARFDDLVNFIPARLTGWLMVLAAPLLGLSAGNAVKIMRRDGRNHTSPNSGIPEAAAAGALGVRIGGPSSYGGVLVDKPTIGDPVNPLSRQAYRGAIRLMYGAEAILMLFWLMVTSALWYWPL